MNAGWISFAIALSDDESQPYFHDSDSWSNCDTELVTCMSDISHEEEGGSEDRNEATKSDTTAVNEKTAVAIVDLAIDCIVPEKRESNL